MWGMRFPCTGLTCLLLVSLAWATEDEQALRDWVLTTNAAHREQYSQGRLVANVIHENPRQTWTVRAAVYWKGERTFYDYEEFTVSGQTGRPSRTHARMILLPGRQLWRDVDHGVSTDKQQKLYAPQEVLQLRPDQHWLGLSARHTGFDRLFDPKLHPREKHILHTYRDDNGDVVHEQLSLVSGLKGKGVWSAKLGGRLTLYEWQGNSHGYIRDSRTTLEWAQNVNGDWYCKNYARKKSGGTAPASLVFNVTEFDIRTVVPDSKFDPKSLLKEDGTYTVVTTPEGQRTQRAGQPPQDDKIPFDKNAEVIRRGKFAGRKAP